MESTRPRGRSFVEDSPPTSPSRTSLSSLHDAGANAPDDDCEGPEMYDPSVVFDDDDYDDAGNNFEEEDTKASGSSNVNVGDEEDEDEYYNRGRSRSRSVHCNDDVIGDDGKLKGLSPEELTAQLALAAKNNDKDNIKPPVVRTGALKQSEVQALKMGLQEATHQTKPEERLEEAAEIEAAIREKEERSVSISNCNGGRGSLQLLASPIGVDPPMRRVKVLLLGDSSVGKSSLIHRITDNTFKRSLVSTVGVDYKVRKLNVNGENVQVQLWDTAGSEKFHKITQSYYRGVHGIMLVFDVSNRKSFKHVSYWLNNISKHANENVQVQLVGNKVDLRPEDKKDSNVGKVNNFIRRRSIPSKESDKEEDRDPFVRSHEGTALASKFQIKYAETSALNNTNIEESLSQCVKQVINHIDNPTLIGSLRDKLQKKDSKSRLMSKDSTDSSKSARMSSGEKKSLGLSAEGKADPSISKLAKENSKEKENCAIS